MSKRKAPRGWHDRYWHSPDGLKLHYRDYDGPADRPPILCLPGLTRNARDFERLAERLAGDWRVIAVDLRGRGGSERDPNPARYAPLFYAGDVIKLLDQLGIAEAVFVGTSLGGIVTMMMAGTVEERIAGALINDIGPAIEREGLNFIARYVGAVRRYADFDEAAAALAEVNAQRYPNFTDDDWLEFAHRVCVEVGGRIVPDYDPAVAANFHATMITPSPEFWHLAHALAGRPVTILRGELSDLFSVETAERMEREIPGAELVTIPGVGHAPTLDESKSIAALNRLLKRVLARDDIGEDVGPV